MTDMKLPSRGPNYLRSIGGALLFGGLLLFALLQQQVAAQAQSSANIGPFYEGPGVLPAQILKAHGFRVEEHGIISKDGYQIRLTRGLNPLINRGKRGLRNRLPIICLHGILESFNVWVVNSFGAKPRNFSNETLTNVSLSTAVRRFRDEPSAKSLALLAMNLGHEVWLVSRRGFPGSQAQRGNPVHGVSGVPGLKQVEGPISGFLDGITDYGRLTTQIKFSINKRFWNFSLDEQARFDVPAVVDYVLEKTGHKQVSVVAHSAGGALTLMSMSLFPALNHKINHAILWAEAFSLGRKDLFRELTPSRPALEGFLGAVPPTFTTDQLQAIFGLLCSSKVTAVTLCEPIGDLILGPSLGQSPLRAEFLNSLLYSSSSHELAQLLQNVDKGGRMHLFDYGREVNLQKYGRPDAAAYNLTRVTNRQLSFYEGNTDTLVSKEDVEATRRLLLVPNRRHLVPGAFNHNGYFFHKDNARLAVIPSLREIHQFSERAVRKRMG